MTMTKRLLIGASVAFLTFDRDALEGGITGEGLAAEAAEAMARAI